MKSYKESDYVDIVDAAGNDLPPVPKAWVGTDLLEPGVKRKGKGATSSSSSSSASTREPGQEPAGNGSREDWAAFAVEKGAKPEDLVDGDGKDLGRDEIRAKYGTPAS